MAEYDVIVVGGGPIGSVAARYAAINGAKNTDPGRPRIHRKSGGMYRTVKYKGSQRV